MRGKDLLINMSDIDNKLISEAEKAVDKKKHTKVTKWIIAAAACLCLCACGSFPVMAAVGNDFAYEMLYSIMPATAQRLKPVNVSCVDNGIEMSVVAAEIDGDNVTVLVSMRDVIEDRIDETTDLFDSYRIHTPYDQYGGCEMASYDEDTHTVVFLLNIGNTNHELMPGDKLTFSVSELLTNKNHIEHAIPQIDLSDLPQITDFADDPEINGWSTASDTVQLDEKGALYDNGVKVKMMAPDENNAVVLEPGVILTGYGIVDGKLHVQLRYMDVLSTDNHGWIYIKDGAGDIIDSDSIVYARFDSNADSYAEYTFNYPVDELDDCELWGEFYTCDTNISGNWEITFPITGK